ADHPLPAHQQPGQIDLAVTATHQTDDHQAAVDGECGEVGRQIARADAVEHDVDSPAARRFAHPRGEIAVAVVDVDVRAALDTALATLVASGGHQHALAALATQADRGRADAAAAAVHQHAAALQYLAEEKDVQKRGEKDLGQRAGFLVRQALRHVHG